MLVPGDGVLESRLLEPDGLDPLWFGSLFLPSDLDGKRDKSGSGWTTVSTLCRCLCMGGGMVSRQVWKASKVVAWWISQFPPA